MKSASPAAIFFLALFAPVPALIGQDFTLDVVSWNVESGGARVSTIARELRDDFDGVELWGLSEVRDDQAAATFEAGAEEGENVNLQRITGTTGGNSNDRLAILFDSAKLTLLETLELHEANVTGTVRSPLVAKLQVNNTDKVFFFMVNHLHRGNMANRHAQATTINQWAATQQFPVIAVGDYNFDWHYQNGDTDHDQGYDNMIHNGVFEWVRPEELFPTNSSGHRSVLDFVFLGGPVATRMGWQATSKIYVRTNDFPDGDLRSDHRPVTAVIEYTPQFAGPTPFAAPANGIAIRRALPGDSAEPLAARIEAIEKALRIENAKVQPAVPAPVRVEPPVARVEEPTRSVEDRLSALEKKVDLILEELKARKSDR